MAVSRIKRPIRLAYFAFALPDDTIPAGGFKEYSNIDIHKDGYSPIAFSRVSSNRAGICLCGFQLRIDNETAYVFLRNVTDHEITLSGASIWVTYYYD